MKNLVGWNLVELRCTGKTLLLSFAFLPPPHLIGLVRDEQEIETYSLILVRRFLDDMRRRRPAVGAKFLLLYTYIYREICARLYLYSPSAASFLTGASPNCPVHPSLLPVVARHEENLFVSAPL